MNRDIKFRVWDGGCFRGNLKQYFLNLSNGEISVVAYSDLYDEYYEANERGESLIIQQYTGLKDKNGVDIYEGDIIVNYISYSESLGEQIENSIGVVKWISREGKWDYSGWYAYPADLPWGDDDNNVEIIGNIFENPELLKA